jgi:uncharacterized repeat protein (TIGR01451 family)
MKSRLFRLVSLLVIMSMIVMPASAQTPTPPKQPVVQRTPVSGELQPRGMTPKTSAVEAGEPTLVEPVVTSNEPAYYIVTLEDAPLATYAGGVPGLKATSPSATGKTRLDVKSADSKAYVAYLQTKQAAFLTKASSILGYAPKVRFDYQYATNGVSLVITPLEAQKIAAMPGVKVYKAPVETPLTDVGPTLIGAPAVWNGETADGTMTQGEDIIVGIIDTGINFDHPSFAATSTIDTYVYPVAAKFFGVCDPTNALQYDAAYAAACNNKLIGAFTYVRGDPMESQTPEDSEGHGSHTASTVAGNHIAVVYDGIDVTISGVAPHARIISFDVCVPTPPNGACYSDATVKAVDDAILTGVKVINYSISGGSNPYGDIVELAFLNATSAGIFVSTSAGNAGDTTGASSVAHRSPWVSTVAASTHDRIFALPVNIAGPGTVPPELTGIGAVPSGANLTADLVGLPIKYSPSNLNGCAEFTPGFFTGSVALVQRGTCNFSVKEANAVAAGAQYVIIFNSRTGPPAGMSGVVGPISMISIEDGLAIKAWIDANPTATVNIGFEIAYVQDPNYQDIVASFSSFGPNTTFDVLKPDITAPGVSILAAVADDTIAPSGTYELDLYQGTSMSSPHNAGSAALIMSLHPDWSPAMVKSALMLTAKDGLKADRSALGEGVRPATPMDEGSGRVALEVTALTGLVMDETIANYEAADPALGGDPQTLNLASLYDSTCVGNCTWTRTFTSVSDAEATYTAVAPAWVTVTPSTFTIVPGDTQQVVFTATVTSLTMDEWAYGSISFETTDKHAGLSFYQGFSSTTFPPTGWSVFNLDGGGTTWLRSSTYGAAYHAYSAAGDQNGWLVTPNIPLGADPFVSFWEWDRYSAWYQGHYVYVCDTTNDCSAPPTNYVQLAEIQGNDTWLYWELPLAAYANKTVKLAFVYTGNNADVWYVDDVTFGNYVTPISNVHLPLAVLPSTGNLPTAVKFDTYRDADGETLTDLVAIEITDLTTYIYGLVKADLESFVLNPDPTPGEAFDDLSQVYVTSLYAPAGTVRLVAEITESTSSDIDLFVGYDFDGNGLPSKDEIIYSSATGAVLEYISALDAYYGFPVEYWVLVQNFDGAPGDTVTLATGAVGLADEGNLTVTGPTTNPALAPFSLDFAWNEATEKGDRLYGYVDVCADAACGADTYIGYTVVDIRRLGDDVVKTADKAVVNTGDTLTYTIDVSNHTPEDRIYTISDVIPDGTTYVPGSVTGGAVYDTGTNTITWTGTVPGSKPTYVMTTNATDPNCDTPLGGYIDAFTEFGFSPSTGIFGNAITWTYTSLGSGSEFYGETIAALPRFVDDGYILMDAANYSSTGQDLPDPALPNAVVAPYWADFRIVADVPNLRGVTAVGWGAGSLWMVEFDDVEAVSDSTARLDYEVFFWSIPDPTIGNGADIMFAYNNVNSLSSSYNFAQATIGLENYDGTEASQYSYNSIAPTNGLVVCYDWGYPSTAHTITYQVTVDSDAVDPIVNTVVHDTDSIYTAPETAVAETIVGPHAVDDFYTTDEDVTKVVDAPGVLGNDIDPAVTGGTHAVVAALVSGPDHGKLTLMSDGGFTYIPNKDFNGIDTFTYNMVTFPAKAWADSAVVTITVNPVNDAPVADVIANETWLARVPNTYDVHASFSDVDSADTPPDTLTFSATFEGGALPAWLHLDANTGIFSGTPANEDVGEYEIVVTVTDSGSLTASSTFTLEVTLNPFLIFLPSIY